MKNILLLLALCLCFCKTGAQTNIVTYAGNGGKESFYDVMQIADGTFLVCGYADNLDWISSSVPQTQLTYTGTIPNALGTNRYGFILHLSNDLQTILNVVHFPQGAVEDIRFMKTNTQPYTLTGDLFISCNTADSDPNNGGYIIAKLDNNFVSGTPTALSWFNIVWAKSGPKDYHPWDVTSKGEVYYISGEAYGYDWSAMYCLGQDGKRKVVNNWRTHWLKSGTEWRGTPASSYPGGIDSVNYSGIALKTWGRCELRSWTAADYNAVMSDGNGGTRVGKWPLDVLFSGPCDPAAPTATSPGYTDYSQASCCPVYGGNSISIDRRNDNVYIGMNFKSVAGDAYGNSPDFEPAVIAMDSTGSLLWWSRLYHEITPAGDTMESVPDQYVDALAIDYAHDRLVVGARCHGNNTENFWEGNTVASNPAAYGFQNQFTGTNGNIHISWLGKFRLGDGVLTNSTYMAELAEATGGLGTAAADPNLDGWPDPNTGWPNVNTTKMAKNGLKVSSNGSVCVLAVGRQTITTANAYQKMVKPYYGGHSCWNNFVRVYDSAFHKPLYSSLIIGKWDTLTQAGGDNTDMYGVYKTSKGVICVGHQKADTAGVAAGNDLPVTNVTPWGSSTPQGESAVLVYYEATDLYNDGDSITTTGVSNMPIALSGISVYPNPASKTISVLFSDKNAGSQLWNYSLIDLYGRIVSEGTLKNAGVDVSNIIPGLYQLQVMNEKSVYSEKVVVGW